MQMHYAWISQDNSDIVYIIQVGHVNFYLINQSNEKIKFRKYLQF